MESCTTEGGALGAGDVEAYCQCSLDGITSKWTYDEFQALESGDNQEAATEMMEIVTGCMGEL